MASRFLQFLHLFALFSFLPFSFSSSFSRLIETKGKISNAEHLILLRERMQSVRFNPSKSKQISWHPRVSIYEDFLSDRECEHLISLAHGGIEKPLVVDSSASTGMQRTISTGKKFLVNSEQDEILSKIEERISLWTLLPKDHGGGIQVWHYGVNDSYGPHFDFYENNEDKPGGNRVATVLIYLSNVTRGGETNFPKSQTTGLKDESFSECASAGYAIKPVKGSAVFFFNLNLDSTPDNSSLHQSCKVLEGAKWSATKYFHTGPTDRRQLTSSLTLTVNKEECSDEDDNCASWAEFGECERNPIFMLGSADYSGACRKSCNAC
ncbi:putative prolyl 4-hydroxylase 6 isoform X1 [Carex rostrata]